MERFFASIGMPTDIHTLIGKEVTDAQIEEVALKCTNNDSITIGALKFYMLQISSLSIKWLDNMSFTD